VAAAPSFVSNALGSHMVLQRAPARANIWGWTNPSTAVHVTFGTQQLSATSDARTGAWNVFLPATPAGGPYTISVKSDSGQTASLEDVLFGDVWVCSGQSNMQMTVHSANNATAEIAAAAGYPRIRVFTTGQGTTSTTPLNEFGSIAQAWSVASPSSIGANDWGEFSAVCWFFGRDIYDKTQVPQGLISSNWGGTRVQAWMSPDALAKCKTNSLPKDPNDPSVLWNAMIVPLLPMSLLGATWYQGESNAGEAQYYACGFPAMIADWRLKWGGETPKDFGFYFVQLAPWASGDHNVESLTRIAQTWALKLPRVGLGVAMDSGDPSSPLGDIHPRFKQIVGYRISLAARALTYGEKIQYLGPTATQYSVVQDGPAGQASVSFEPASIGSGLVFKAATCITAVDQCSGYELGASDGKWYNATATISGASLLVSANIGQTKLTGVRYAFNNYPIATLFNKEDLPALPFVFPNPIH